MIRRAAPAILAAVMSVGVIAACGAQASSNSAHASAAPSTSLAADPLASLTALAIDRQALNDLTEVSSVHFTLSSSQLGQTGSFSFTIVNGVGCTGTDGASAAFSVIYRDNTVWIKPSAATWRLLANLGSASAHVVALASGKWIRESAANARGYANVSEICTLRYLANPVFKAGTQFVKEAPTTLGRQRIVEIKEIPEGTTDYVTDTPNPYLIKSIETGGMTATFTDYGAQATITPPPGSEVIDESILGTWPGNSLIGY